MKLLKISDRDEHEGFDDLFEEVAFVDVEQVSPRVMGEKVDVKLGKHSLEEFDAAYLDIPRENAVFGRVLLEIMEENHISMNHSSAAFFSMAKKNYLYYVLHEKNIEAPETVSVASEKAVRNIDQELDFPVAGRLFKDLEEAETAELENIEQVEEFAEGINYGEDFLLFQEITEGDKYRCLATRESIISLKDSSESWKVKEGNLSYSNIPKELEELAEKTRRVLGSAVAEILIEDGKVIDVNPNPDLKKYTEISGKNAYEDVADVLRQGANPK